MANMLRNLPSLNELLDNPALKSLVDRVSHSVVVFRARRLLDDLRRQAQSAAAAVPMPSAGELSRRIADWITSHEPALYTPIINATGQILHPQLGRSPLAEEALQAIAAVSRGYACTRGDMAMADRASDFRAVEPLLSELTGAEGAMVVNDGSAGLLLSLATLASGREAIVARGQLGTLRPGCSLPALIAASGAILREVGATNRVAIEDYSAAVQPQTAVILRAAPSDFSVVGSTQDAPAGELARLAMAKNLPLIEFVENASLRDLTTYGLSGWQVVADSVKAGVDLTILAGDRWIGGPPCGIILGRRRLIERLLAHPLRPALQAGKQILAALAATLRLHQDPELAERAIPLYSLLSTPVENLQHRAERLAFQIAASGAADAVLVPGATTLGIGPAETATLPTVCLALTPRVGSCEALAAALAASTTPVVGRLEAGRLLLDLRSVAPREDLQLAAAFEALAPRPEEPKDMISPTIEVPTIAS
jgi:L-seryl-tRNA(Ser) seleniumtransferase